MVRVKTGLLVWILRWDRLVWPPAIGLGLPEFLTEETTCTNEMPKETTSENFCQKRPLLSGGRPCQATRGHAATANGGRPCHVDMPPP
jgi:hypothetical protein